MNWMNQRAYRGLASLFAVLSCLAYAAGAAAQDVNTDYKLHAGDAITVSVWKELELQRKVVIRPDGRFSFPLAGEIQAAGRSADQVRVDIESKLTKYIPEAVVAVMVWLAAVLSVTVNE